ncbi:hypothetical protein OH77DRAFT_179403 [Trametes cingulata]|nr:hypothetical protein OH77DRAFT_179403 [Trametes cingulata]
MRREAQHRSPSHPHPHRRAHRPLSPAGIRSRACDAMLYRYVVVARPAGCRSSSAALDCALRSPDGDATLPCRPDSKFEPYLARRDHMMLYMQHGPYVTASRANRPCALTDIPIRRVSQFARTDIESTARENQRTQGASDAMWSGAKCDRSANLQSAAQAAQSESVFRGPRLLCQSQLYCTIR